MGKITSAGYALPMHLLVLLCIASVASIASSAPELRMMKYTTRSADEAKAWQNNVRARLAARLRLDDLLREKRTIPLEPKQFSSTDKGVYRFEEIEISSTPGRRMRIIVTTLC